jgi:chaperonin GroES
MAKAAIAKVPKFEPAKGQVLIRRNEAQAVSKGGIFVVEGARERPMEGVVLALNGSEWLEVKDLVVFGKYDGVDVRIDEEDLLLIEEEKILGRRK